MDGTPRRLEGVNLPGMWCVCIWGQGAIESVGAGSYKSMTAGGSVAFICVIHARAHIGCCNMCYIHVATFIYWIDGFIKLYFTATSFCSLVSGMFLVDP